MEHVKVERRQDFAILQLVRGRANPINHEMVREIREAIQHLETDSLVRGAIITGQPNFFSAGLDLIELSSYGHTEIKAFWADFSEMMIELAKFSKPLIAAITGHSPAGGAVIAVTCDYRLMAEGPKYTIGLNEVAVGIVISQPIFELYRFWLGNRTAYQALLEGKLFTIEQALAVGLIDELHPSDQLLEAAESKMQKLLRANDHILRETKKILRHKLWDQISVDGAEELEERARYWMTAESQNNLQRMVDMLTSRKS